MVEINAAAAFSIRRRAESDIRLRLKEEAVKSSIRQACQAYIEPGSDLETLTNRIFNEASASVAKAFCPIQAPNSVGDKDERARQ